MLRRRSAGAVVVLVDPSSSQFKALSAAGIPVSVDVAAGTGTGVSAHDRAVTIRRLAHSDAAPADFQRPGHVFPLAARPGGLAERAGHTEASNGAVRGRWLARDGGHL